VSAVVILLARAERRVLLAVLIGCRFSFALLLSYFALPATLLLVSLLASNNMVGYVFVRPASQQSAVPPGARPGAPVGVAPACTRPTTNVGPSQRLSRFCVWVTDCIVYVWVTEGRAPRLSRSEWLCGCCDRRVKIPPTVQSRSERTANQRQRQRQRRLPVRHVPVQSRPSV